VVRVRSVASRPLSSRSDTHNTEAFAPSPAEQASCADSGDASAMAIPTRIPEIVTRIVNNRVKPEPRVWVPTT